MTDPLSFNRIKISKDEAKATRTFTDQVAYALEGSRNEKNPLEFMDGVMDRLAQGTIPEAYDAYVKKKAATSDKAALFRWIVKSLNDALPGATDCCPASGSCQRHCSCRPSRRG